MATDDSKQLKKLTVVIEKLLSREIAPVAPVLPIAPVAPIAPLLPSNPEDHGLLLRLDEKVNSIIIQIKDIKDTTVKRIDDLEKDKLDTKDSYPILYKKDVDEKLDCLDNLTKKHQDAIVKIMTFGTAGIILIGIIEFVINKFL